MSEEYVVASARLSCNCGSMTRGFVLTSDRRIKSEIRFIANKSDIRVENILDFGTCSALHSPCIRTDVSFTPWLDCKDDVIIAGHPAVLTSSKIMCSIGGGTITVDGSGQPGS